MLQSVGSSMATIRHLEPFRPKSECISAYLERVQLFFAANDVPQAKQVLGLLSAIRGKVYDLLSDLLAPEKPAEKSFDELKAILKAHYEPKPLVIAERFTFHRRNQHAGETVAEYVAELRCLATHCEFGPTCLKRCAIDLISLSWTCPLPTSRCRWRSHTSSEFKIAFFYFMADVKVTLPRVVMCYH